MTANNQACAKAFEILNRSISADRRFPRNVFCGTWECFLFFDSDWMFDVEFVERVQALIYNEGAECACLANLDTPSGQHRRQRHFFISGQTTPDEYRSILRGSNPGEGWVHDIDRFACASNIGQWCMYCERRSEIAVIAVCNEVMAKRYLPSIAPFKAIRVEEAIRLPLSYGFSAQGLSGAWRSELLEQYSR